MTRTITGLFDTYEAAEAVKAHLVTHDGVDASRVMIHGGDKMEGAREEEGFWASLKSLFVPDEDRYAYSEGIRRGGILVSAELDDDQITHAMDVFEEHGAVDLDEREQEWRSSGWKGYESGNAMAPSSAGSGGMASGGMASGDTPASSPGMTGIGAAAAGMAGSGLAGTGGTGTSVPGLTGTGSLPADTSITGTARPDMTTSDMTTSDMSTSDMSTSGMSSAGTPPTGVSASRVEEEGVIPVVEETLRVGKRDTEHGRIRVRSYVTEIPVSEQVSLRQEHVDVQRRPVDRPLTDADAAFRDRTIEAVEHREEAVVSKEARIVEEVVIQKDTAEHTETVKDTVRRQDVEVEDSRTGTTPAPMPRNPL